MANSSSPRNVTYTIDKAGNRTNVSDAGVNTSYTPNNLNQYTTVGGNAVTPGSEHEIAAYQNVNYTYINDERLKSVTSGSNSYQLAYDALGRCVKRTLNNVITYYIYDGEKPIVEYSSPTAIVGRNLYGKGIDEILMRTDYVVVPAGQTYFFQQDHEGSVTHLTNSSGTVIESYRYDAFGAPTTASTTGSFNNRFKFTGREYASTFSIYGNEEWGRIYIFDIWLLRLRFGDGASAADRIRGRALPSLCARQRAAEDLP